MPRLKHGFTSFAVLVLLPLCAPAEGQFRKNFKTVEVTLNRKRPPKVYLMGTAIKVDCRAQQPQHAQAASRLETMLEAELTSNDSRLRPVKEQPDTVISCAVAALSSSRTIESRKVTTYKQTGTKMVWNEKKNKNEEQAVFGNVEETQTFVVIKGSMPVALQVRDAKSGAVLDSDNLEPAFNREFRDGAGAPDQGAVDQFLLTGALNLIVPRLTPTRAAVEVMLARPNDQVDDINKLGSAGLWTRMLEQLEQTKPLSDAKKEPYRLYNLGVANEALAYDAEDLVTSRKLLEQASSYYSRAIAGRPDEKYFRDPQNRISEAITAYAKLDAQQAAYSRAIAAAAAAAPDRTQSRDLAGDSKAAPAAFRNTDVIDLVKAGLDTTNLLASINDASVVEFDLGSEGLKALLAGKVPNSIIAAMRTRQARPARASAGPTPGRKPAAGGDAARPPAAVKPKAPVAADPTGKPAPVPPKKSGQTGH